MWQDNPEGMRPDGDTVRPMLGFQPKAFPPMEHLSDSWEYDFAESCRVIQRE